MLEYVDHLHEHFVTPCSINARGRYNVPTNPDEGYRWVFVLTKISDAEDMSAVLRCMSRVLRSMSGRMGRIGRGGRVLNNEGVVCTVFVLLQ